MRHCGNGHKRIRRPSVAIYASYEQVYIIQWHGQQCFLRKKNKKPKRKNVLFQKISFYNILYRRYIVQLIQTFILQHCCCSRLDLETRSCHKISSNKKKTKIQKKSTQIKQILRYNIIILYVSFLAYYREIMASSLRNDKPRFLLHLIRLLFLLQIIILVFF